MSRFFYEVTATFKHRTTADEWLAWMRDNHIADVMSAGALTARVIQVDPDTEGHILTLSAQYDFTDRAAFDAYLRDHAPRLRAEGLVRFPTDNVTYSRRSGDIVA